MFIAKILLVALSLIFQDKLFQEDSNHKVEEMDTLALPLDHPEWVLASRAMKANGLCPTPPNQITDFAMADKSIEANSLQPQAPALAFFCF